MRTLIPESDLQNGVSRLARQISEDYDGKPLAIVGLLQDSIVLLADLMKLMYVPSQMCIVQTRAVHSGPDKPTSLDIDDQTARIVHNRHVLVVDDVLESGFSLLDVVCQLDDLAPLSVRSAVLLRKEGQHEVHIEPDYVVFDVPNEVIVGYGLDYRGNYRHLPYIAALDPADIVVDEDARHLPHSSDVAQRRGAWSTSGEEFV